MDSSTVLPTPQATTNFMYMLPEDINILIEVNSIQKVMSFIYETGYSTCTKHCCITRSNTPQSNDDSIFEDTVKLVLTRQDIDCGRTISCDLATDCDLSIDYNPVIGANGQQRRRCGPLDPDIDATQGPAEIQRSVKLRQWGIRFGFQNPGTSIKQVALFLDWFLSKKEIVDSRRGRFMNPDVYRFGIVPKEGPIRPQHNNFGDLFGQQINSKPFKEAMQRVKLQKDAVRGTFENSILFSKPLGWLAYNVFWSCPTSGFDQLSKGYLAWRKIWHAFVFCPQPVEELPRRLQNLEPELRDRIPQLQLWGDVQNDYTLFHYQELTRKDLRYTYEHEPQSLRYMLENLELWEDEVSVLNDYVGVRRELSRDHFHACKSAAQRTGSAMDLMLRTRQKVEWSTRKNVELELALEDHVFAARQRFLELKACICGYPDTTPRQPRSRSNKVVKTSLYKPTLERL